MIVLTLLPEDNNIAQLRSLNFSKGHGKSHGKSQDFDRS